jgi:hypothetical protein
VKYWLGDGGEPFGYYRIACVKFSIEIFRRTSFRWLVKRVALKGPTGQRTLDDMDEKAEILWILAENVRYAGLMRQTNAIDLLLAGYFSITSGFGESSLHYGLPISTFSYNWIQICPSQRHSISRWRRLPSLSVSKNIKGP